MKLYEYLQISQQLNDLKDRIERSHINQFVHFATKSEKKLDCAYTAKAYALLLREDLPELKDRIKKIFNDIIELEKKGI